LLTWNADILRSKKKLRMLCIKSPTDDLAIADLKCRKLVIADEILQNRRAVERFAKLADNLH
jgi:hypothetical protein